MVGGMPLFEPVQDLVGLEVLRRLQGRDQA
jgi:hypothetical protein